MRAFRIAYDGRPFHGFQRQPDVPTVEDGIFDALRVLGVAEGKPPGYAAAGRTDAGVSAVAQTVGFESPDWLTPAALTSELPDGVWAWASADAPPEFHATRDAAFREYTYHCYAPDADGGRAREALDRLSGEHDFHNLTPDEENTVRDLQGTVRRDGELLTVTLRAGGFVRELVRRVVSLVRAVATENAPAEKVDRALSPDPLPGPEGIAPAPAYPLILTDVGYPDFSFSVDEDASERARAAVEERRIEATTRARVKGMIVDELG